jgi:LacI family transcriptional regulator
MTRPVKPPPRGTPTVVDVASRAGVALGTVSRVINNSGPVSKKARDAVWAAIADLGFRPNTVARSMRTRTTKAIGFIVPDISNPLFSVIAREAEAVLQNDGYLLNIASSGDSADRERALVRAFAERQCDGIIFSTSDEMDPRVLEALRAARLPLLALDRDIDLPVDKVMTDHARGVRLATKYLFDLGHRRIGLITASDRIYPGRERARAYQAAHVACGVDLDNDLLRMGRLDQEFGALQIGSLLQLDEPPTAVIAGGNQILVGVLQAIQLRGLKIPRDLSLIACDDTAVTQVFSPPITIINRDLAQIGRTAARILLDRLRGKDASYQPTRAVLPTDLRIRDSCAARK